MPTLPISPPDRSDSLWRVTDGRFETLVGGFAVDASDRWRLQLVSRVGQPVPEVQLVSTEGHGRLAMIVTRGREDPDVLMDLALRLDGELRSMSTIGIGDREIVFDEYKFVEDGATVSVGRVRNEFVTLWFQFEQFGYGRLNGEQALRDLADQINFLDDDTLSELEQSLEKAGESRFAVGRNHVMSGDEYHHYGWDVSWDLPEGTWNVGVGRAARYADDRAILAMDNPIQGVTITLLETSFGESLRDAHAVWGMSEFMPASTQRGAGRWVSEGVWADSSGIGRAWLASYQRPSGVVQVLVVADELETDLSRFTEGFRKRKDLVSWESRAKRIEDHRYGLQLKSPGKDWAPRRYEMPGLSGRAAALGYVGESDQMALVALDVPTDSPVGVLSAHLPWRYAPSELIWLHGEVDDCSVTVEDAQDARCYAWSRIDGRRWSVELFRRAGVVYAAISTWSGDEPRPDVLDHVKWVRPGH
jgi:hypothetical protein